MAPFEEKILAYLDGSLSGDDREEVMRAVSISPDRRALLDTHLRLNDLFKVVQKPISAPLSLQRDLATKVPVLALKLPYLAAPSNRRRYGAIFGFFTQMAGWLGSSRAASLGVIAILLSLVGGGVWYEVNHANSNNVASSGSGSSSNGTGLGNGSGLPNGSASPNASALPDRSDRSVISDKTDKSHRTNMSHEPVQENSSPSTNTALSTGTGRNTQAHRNAAAMSNYGPVAGLRSASPHGISLSHAGAKGPQTKAPQTKAPQTKAPLSNIANDIPRAGAGNHTPANETPATPAAPLVTETPNTVNAGSNNSDRTPGNSNASNGANLLVAKDSVARTPELPPADISTISISQTVTAAHISNKSAISYNISNEEQSYVPVRVFFTPGARLIVQPGVAFSKYVTANKIGVISPFAGAANFEAGVDYEISPWLTIGARGGYSNFLQVQPFSYEVQIPGYDRLKQHVYDDSIASVPAVWAGVMLGYQFNPQDQFHFGAGLGGGVAFVPQAISPMGIAEFNAGYEISSALSLRGALTFDVERVRQIAASTISNNTSTLGIISQGQNAPLTSTALGVSVGVVIHP